MKPDRPPHKLPSIGELLSHPTIQGVVERVNQTTLAQRATGFLADVQANLRQRSEQIVVPSLSQLARRLADRLLGQSLVGDPMVNATGVVVGDRWSAPLADAAMHEMLRIAPEYHDPTDEFARRVAKELIDLTGAEAAWVVNNFVAAAKLCIDSEVTDAEVAPHVGLINPAEFGMSEVATISDRLQAGASLVAVDGAGLLGGPRCGVLVGRKEVVEKLQRHPMADSVRADLLTLVALESTLGIYHTPQSVIHQIPVWQLLSTSIENLRQRSERIAQLLAATDAVADAEPIHCESIWCDLKQLKLAGPSWSIAVRGARDSADELTRQFCAASPAVFVRSEKNRIVLNLRSVFPRWDQQLVAAVETSEAL